MRRLHLSNDCRRAGCINIGVPTFADVAALGRHLNTGLYIELKAAGSGLKGWRELLRHKQTFAALGSFDTAQVRELREAGCEYPASLQASTGSTELIGAARMNCAGGFGRSSVSRLAGHWLNARFYTLTVLRFKGSWSGTAPANRFRYTAMDYSLGDRRFGAGHSTSHDGMPNLLGGSRALVRRERRRTH